MKRMPPIMFIDSNFEGEDLDQDNHMVIIVEIRNFSVKKILVDQGSSLDILYWKTYKKLQLPEDVMVHMTS